MKITTLQINAILVILILAGMGGSILWMLISHNGLIDDGRFGVLILLVKDIILALIGAMWFFTKHPAPPDEGKE